MSTPFVSERRAAAQPHSTAIGALLGRRDDRGLAVAEVNRQGETVTVWSHADLVLASERCADAMRTGAAPGDSVLGLAAPGPAQVAWFVGAMMAGVRFVPLLPNAAPAEVRGLAARTRAALAVVEPGDHEIHGLAGLPMIDAGAARGGVGRQPSEGGVCGVPPGELVLSSSGTTGRSKLAVRTMAALDADAENVVRGTGLTGRDGVLIVTPLTHSYGVDLMMGCLLSGAAMRILSGFDSAALAKEAAGPATVLPAVPAVLDALSLVRPDSACSLRLVLSAGSLLPPGVRERFENAWGVRVGQLYGATELGTVAVDTPDRAGFDATTVGAPLPGVSMRIVDRDQPERVLAIGEEGQLAVRSPSMLAGYLDDPFELADGHLLTGDLARIRPDGRVTITGRLKLLIDVGAFKVNPLAVEAELDRHPAIRECVVVGMPVTETITRLRAVCVAQPGARPTEAELRAFLRERLSPNRIPRVFEFVEQLTRTPAGKVVRTGI